MSAPIYALLVALLFVPIVAFGVRRDRAAAARRASLLDPVARLFEEARITLGADRFPVLDAEWDARHVRIELIPDTLVVRRLPQLWLRLTVTGGTGAGLSIGALARPTGAEFYSIVQDFPQRFMEAEGEGEAMLVRGDGDPSPQCVARAQRAFDAILLDRTMKEVAVTPKGVRLVRQIAQGDRAAHLFRQISFPVSTVPVDMVEDMLAACTRLEQALQPIDTAAPSQWQGVAA